MIASFAAVFFMAAAFGLLIGWMHAKSNNCDLSYGFTTGAFTFALLLLGSVWCIVWSEEIDLLFPMGVCQ